MGRRTVKQNPNYENTFDFFDGKKEVASVTIYDDGLIEFQGTHQVVIECVGTKEEEIIIGKENPLSIKDAV